jgi:antitoxin ParD1/3/4
MSEVTFSLGDHLAGFIEAQVKDGRYESPSDVVRAGLRLLEEREAGLDALRLALLEGENSGISDRDVLDIWAVVERELGAPCE